MLEMFFSRLAQSYAWLGGVNIKAAGVSSKRADTMTYEDRVKAHGSLDYEEMDKNIELAEERLRAFKFVQGDAERTKNKKKVDEIRRELKELELQQRKDFLATTKEMEKRIQGMIDQNERDKRAARTLDMSNRILELTEKMYNMTH